MHFIGTYSIAEHVEYVGCDNGLDDHRDEAQVDIEAFVLRQGVGAEVVLIEPEDAESVETRLAQSFTVLGRVHAEAAWAAGAGCNKGMLTQNLLARQPVFFELLKVPDQGSGRVISRIALAAIAIFLADLERFIVGYRHWQHPVTESATGGAQELIVPAGHSRQPDRGRLTLLSRERSALWLVPLRGDRPRAVGLQLACRRRAHAIARAARIRFARSRSARRDSA